MAEVQHMQQEASQAATSSTDLHLIIDLPTFPHAVLYQQVSSFAAAAMAPFASAAGMGVGAAAGAASATASALPLATTAPGVPGGRPWSVPAAMQAGSSSGGASAGATQVPDKILVLVDPEVGVQHLGLTCVPLA